MKKITLFAVITIPLMAGIMLTGYLSSNQKHKAAQTKMLFAKEDLIAAQEYANEAPKNAATPEEWNKFRNESELKIRDIEIRIAESNAKLKYAAEKLDSRYEKKIAVLELQNKDMKSRLEAYERIQSDWETFRRDFNHDITAIGNELKDLIGDNKR
jgi:hypothetical protein